MKKIIPVVVSITVVLQLQFTAGLLCRASAQAIENQGYKLNAVYISDENIELVQFTLATDCYVTVRVMDRDMTVLAEGEMSTGAYNVYYKAIDGNVRTSIKCCMEVYRNQNKFELLFKKEIIIPVN